MTIRVDTVSTYQPEGSNCAQSYIGAYSSVSSSYPSFHMAASTTARVPADNWIRICTFLLRSPQCNLPGGGFQGQICPEKVARVCYDLARNLVVRVRCQRSSSGDGNSSGNGGSTTAVQQQRRRRNLIFRTSDRGKQ
jgi:hypothetical protein